MTAGTHCTMDEPGGRNEDRNDSCIVVFRLKIRDFSLQLFLLIQIANLFLEALSFLFVEKRQILFQKFDVLHQILRHFFHLPHRRNAIIALYDDQGLHIRASARLVIPSRNLSDRFLGKTKLLTHGQKRCSFFLVEPAQMLADSFVKSFVVLNVSFYPLFI